MRKLEVNGLQGFTSFLELILSGCRGVLACRAFEKEFILNYLPREVGFQAVLVVQVFSPSMSGIFVDISEKIPFASSGVDIGVSQSSVSVSLCVPVV